MALMHHIVFSASSLGLGAVAASPLGCSALAPPPNATVAELCATPPPGFNWTVAVDVMVARVAALAAAGLIDPLSNLNRSAAWLFSGCLDTVVYPAVAWAADTQLRRLAGPGARIAANYSVPAEHAWPVNDPGANPCWWLGPPFVNNCGYDGPGAMLRHIFAPAPLRPPSPVVALRRPRAVNATPYLPVGHPALVGECAYAYVPTRCEADPDACRVHVHYHGCGGEGGDSSGWGLNGYAESNGMIVVYPQAAQDPVLNPRGCWWEGIEEGMPAPPDGWDTRGGTQLAVVTRIVDDLPAALARPAPRCPHPA